MLWHTHKNGTHFCCVWSNFCTLENQKYNHEAHVVSAAHPLFAQFAGHCSFFFQILFDVSVWVLIYWIMCAEATSFVQLYIICAVAYGIHNKITWMDEIYLQKQKPKKKAVPAASIVCWSSWTSIYVIQTMAISIN